MEGGGGDTSLTSSPRLRRVVKRAIAAVYPVRGCSPIWGDARSEEIDERWGRRARLSACAPAGRHLCRIGAGVWEGSVS